MRPNSITAGTPQKMKVLQPYRNPGEASAFILGAKTTANVLGYEVVRTTEIGVIPSALELTLVQPPQPEPAVTIEIPEEDPVQLVDGKPAIPFKLVKRAKIKKKVKRAEPDAGTQ